MNALRAIPWYAYVAALLVAFALLLWVLLPSPVDGTVADVPGPDTTGAPEDGNVSDSPRPQTSTDFPEECVVVANWAWDHESQTYVETDDPTRDVIVQEDCGGIEVVGIYN